MITICNKCYCYVGMRIMSFQPLNISKRFKAKQKWAATKKQKSGPELALKYFDSFYKPVYGDLWPSMRVALLSQNKYAALVNTSGTGVADVQLHLMLTGAEDVMRSVRDELSTPASATSEELPPGERPLQSVHKDTIADLTRTTSPNHADVDTLSQVASQHIVGQNQFDEFMPTTRVLPPREEMAEQEVKQGFYFSSDEYQIQRVSSPAITVPDHLSVFAKPRGDVSLFPAPRSDTVSNKLGYYLYDLASVLPVLALDLKPNDRVLDMCAAPGGKTLTMLHTMLPSHVTCVDTSASRLSRLQQVIASYLPPSSHSGLRLVQQSGEAFCQHRAAEERFDKILVDAPCYTDRHVVSADADVDNLFREQRKGERLMVQDTQKKLLKACLQVLAPGGVAVYSTCTLSAPQNDGIIQAVLSELATEMGVQMVVMETRQLVRAFQPYMDFYQSCRFGELVVPNLTANFGPMYFCKLKRVE